GFLSASGMSIMKSTWALAAAVLLGTFAPGRTGESPETQIDFIRKLRAKGYGDLALERIEILQKQGDAALAPLLILESARTRMAQARDKPADQRLAMIDLARNELQGFVGKHAGKPEGVQAQVELARLTTIHGQA